MASMAVNPAETAIDPTATAVAPEATAVAPAGTSTTPGCQVTNNLTKAAPGAAPAQSGWDGSVVVFSASNNPDLPSSQGYQQTLNPMSFVQNGQSLAASESDSIALDTSNPLYDLIFAQSNNYFPVLETSEAWNFFDSTQPPFPPVTLNSAASKSCIDAFAFVQDILAYPSSSMATGFQAALNNTTSQAQQASDIDEGIDAFFASTPGYQDVTLASYVAVSTYLSAFATAWANFGQSYTYYLYQSNSTSSTTPTTGSSAGSATATAAGTIVFTKTGTSPSALDPSGGYTITFTDAKGTKSRMFFQDRQLKSDPAGTNFQLTFTQLSQFSSSADPSVLVPFMYGIMGNQQVIGVGGTAMDSGPGKTVDQKLQDFLQTGGFQLFMDLMNIGLGLEAFASLAEGIKKSLKELYESVKGKPTPEQIEAAKQKPEDEANNDASRREQRADSQVGNIAPVVEPNQKDLADAEAKEATEKQQQDVKEQKAADLQQEKSDAAQLGEEAEIELTPGEEQAYSETASNYTATEAVNVTDPDAASKLKTIEDSQSTAEETIQSQGQADESAASTQQKAEMAQDEEAEDEARETSEAEAKQESQDARDAQNLKDEERGEGGVDSFDGE